MRIVAAREVTVPIGSNMRNAAIDFSGMTVSVAALVTDEIRHGKPVIGYGFNSNGRYAQGGILRERLFPRILAAPPDSLCDPGTGMLGPALIWHAAMRNEKPGGHGERAVAMAVIDMAAWDLAAKLAGLPLHVLLAELFPHASRSTTTAVYAAGGYYTDGGIVDLQHELLAYVDEGYRAVKMKVGGAPLDEDLCRIEAVRNVLPDDVALAVDANARLDLETALIEQALRAHRVEGARTSIYVVGDEFTGESIQRALDDIKRLNAADPRRARARIHAIGFPEGAGMPPFTNIRFSALMRAVAANNDGTFVGLTNEKPCKNAVDILGTIQCLSR